MTSPEWDSTPEFAIPEVLVLDFDRMLSDNAEYMKRLYRVAETEGVDVAHIDAARQATEDDGKTFEPLSFLKDSLTTEGYDRLCYSFTNAEGDILYPDARRFLGRLQHADVPHIIMTYGPNFEWQKLKLAASGYPMGFVLTDTPHKSLALMSLRTPSSSDTGTFDMYLATPGRAKYAAQTLTFIDDKAKAFDGFPDTAAYKGFWLQRGPLLLSQMGEVPPNVTIIHSLDDLVVTEDGRTIVGTPRSVTPFVSKRSRWASYDDSNTEPGIYLPLSEQSQSVVHDTSRYGFWLPLQIEYKPVPV